MKPQTILRGYRLDTLVQEFYIDGKARFAANLNVQGEVDRIVVTIGETNEMSLDLIPSVSPAFLSADGRELTVTAHLRCDIGSSEEGIGVRFRFDVGNGALAGIRVIAFELRGTSSPRLPVALSALASLFAVSVPTNERVSVDRRLLTFDSDGVSGGKDALLIGDGSLDVTVDTSGRLRFARWVSFDPRRGVLAKKYQYKIGDERSKLSAWASTWGLNGLAQPGSARMLLTQASATRAGSASQSIALHGIPGRGLAAFLAETIIDPDRETLRHAYGDGAFSVLPTFRDDATGAATAAARAFGVWSVVFHLTRDEWIPVRMQQIGEFTITGELRGLRTHDGGVPTVVWKVFGPNGDLANGVGLKVDHAATSTKARRLHSGADNGETFLLMDARTERIPGASSGARLRVGALDIGLVPTALPTPNSASNIRSQIAVGMARTRGLASAAAFDVTVQIPVGFARPGGEDPLTGSELVEENAALGDKGGLLDREVEGLFVREAPLVIPTNLSAPDSDGLVLQLREESRDGRVPVVTVELQSTREVATPLPVDGVPSLVVLDRQPFVVAAVSFESFLSQADGTSNVVAQWSTRTGQRWLVRNRVGSFDITLPPQGIGETVEREKNLMDRQDKALDFRLAPTTRLRIRPTATASNFREIPWNLRRLLEEEHPEATDLSVTMQFELLYGMLCSVEHPFYRLADLMTRVGRFPGRLPGMAWTGTDQQIQAYGDGRRQWAELFGQLRGRLGVIEPWERATRGELIITQGLSCVIRGKSFQEEKGQAEVADPYVPHSTGLEGGAMYGVEPQAVFSTLEQSFKTRLSSNSAELVDPRFSALGAYALQRASFQNGLSRISARVDMGRVSEYTVERFGRITKFWTKAKHVIVYSRTVLPTAQFAPWQTPLHGRAVVRKIREYVELLEPNRFYPDDKASADWWKKHPVEPTTAGKGAINPTPGCLRGCHYKPGTQIAVLSRWGRDVHHPTSGALGWVVPLWNPKDAALQPRVYPKPVIHVSLWGDQGGKPTPTFCEIRNAEDLFFYTQTAPNPSAGGASVGDPPADSDDWHPVESYDYVDLPDPAPRRAGQEDTTDAIEALPDDRATAGGFGTVTVHLIPPDRAIDLTAGRVLPDPSVQDDVPPPMLAKIDSITVMRAMPRPTDPDKPDNNSLESFRTLAEHAESLLKTTAQAASAVADARIDIATLQKRIEDGSVGAALKNSYSKAVNNTKTAVHQAAKQIADRQLVFEARTRTELDKVRERVLSLDESAKQAQDTIAGVIYRLRSEAPASIKDFFEGLRQGKKYQSDTERKAFIARYMAYVEQPFALLPVTLEPLQRLVDSTVGGWIEVRDSRVYPSLAAIEKETTASATLALDALARIDQSLIQLETEVDATVRVASRAAPTWMVDGAVAMQLLTRDVLRDVDYARAVVEKALHEGVTLPATTVRDAVNTVRATITGAEKTVTGVLCPAARPLTKDCTGQSAVSVRLASIRLDLERVDPCATGVCLTFDEYLALLTPAYVQALDKLNADLATLSESVRARTDVLITYFKNLHAFATQALFAGMSDPEAWVKDRLAAYGEQARADLAAAAQRMQANAGRIAESVIESVAPELRAVGNAVNQQADSMLRTVRAFGDSPTIQQLEFTRNKLAYYYQEMRGTEDAAKRLLHITPSLTQVNQIKKDLNQIGDNLNAMGLRLPTESLLRVVTPIGLERFQLNDVFKNFAGLNFDKLFQGLHLPKEATEKVKVTHGYDKSARRAWLDAVVDDVKIPSYPIFDVGPLAVEISDPVFHATVHASAGLNESPTQKITAQIHATWIVKVGGTPVVLFRETTLEFSEPGSIRFHVDPSKIELPGAMAFINDLLASASPNGSGLSLAITPKGVDSVLSMMLPNIQSGTFGISNLKLGVHFGLEWAPEFAIVVGFFLARRETPFSLTVFILGGGGYIEADARYLPLNGALEARVAIGLMASASLAISLGPLSGGVYIYLGVTVDFSARAGSSSRLAIGVMLLIRGEVSVLGIVSAYVALELSASYDGSQLHCVGRVSLKIKICWCFTLEVHQEVEYNLGCLPTASAHAHLLTTEYGFSDDRLDQLACAYIYSFQ